jgi:hypothetical protein
MHSGERLRKPGKGQAAGLADFPYRHFTGSVQYLADMTRPELQFVASALGANNAAWERECSATFAAPRVELCFQYQAGQRLLEGWVDADWGGDLDTRRSITGQTFRVVYDRRGTP